MYKYTEPCLYQFSLCRKNKPRTGSEDAASNFLAQISKTRAATPPELQLSLNEKRNKRRSSNATAGTVAVSKSHDVLEKKAQLKQQVPVSEMYLQGPAPVSLSNVPIEANAKSSTVVLQLLKTAVPLTIQAAPIGVREESRPSYGKGLSNPAASHGSKAENVSTHLHGSTVIAHDSNTAGASPTGQNVGFFGHDATLSTASPNGVVGTVASVSCGGAVTGTNISAGQSGIAGTVPSAKRNSVSHSNGNAASIGDNIRAWGISVVEGGEGCSEYRIASDVYKKIASIAISYVDEDKRFVATAEELDKRAVDLNKRTDRILVREHELDKRVMEIDKEVEQRVAAKVHAAIQDVINHTIISNSADEKDREMAKQHVVAVDEALVAKASGSPVKLSRLPSHKDLKNDSRPSTGRSGGISSRATSPAKQVRSSPPSTPLAPAATLIANIKEHASIMRAQSSQDAFNDGEKTQTDAASIDDSVQFDNAFGNSTVLEYVDEPMKQKDIAPDTSLTAPNVDYQHSSENPVVIGDRIPLQVRPPSAAVGSGSRTPYSAAPLTPPRVTGGSRTGTAGSDDFYPNVVYGDAFATSHERAPPTQVPMIVIAPAQKVDCGTNTEPMQPAPKILKFSDDLGMDNTFAPESTKKVNELAVVSAEGPLVTRTYNPVVEETFEEKLDKSPDPVLLLYNHYAKHFSEVHKARMLNGIFSFSENETIRRVHDLFGKLHTQLKEVNANCEKCVKEMSVCEDIAKTLGFMLTGMANNTVAKGNAGSLALFKKSLLQLKWRIGEAEFLRMWGDIQMQEFRAILNRLNAQGQDTIKNILRSSKIARDAFELFYSTQSKLSELTNRMDAVSQLIIRHKLPLSQYYQSKDYQSTLGNAHSEAVVAILAGKPATSGAFSIASRGSVNQQNGENPLNISSDPKFNTLFNREAESKMKTDMMIMEKKLDLAYNEIEELTTENFQLTQEKDKTPSALMFYSALYNPGLISAMQQLSHQLDSLRGIVDCSGHFDFVMLRKRLQVCLNITPVVDKFVERYSLLHKQWTKVRYHTFIVRKQSGGDADDAHVCPLCTFDWRASTYAGLDASSRGKAVGLSMLEKAFSHKDLVTQLVSEKQPVTKAKKPRKGRSGIEVGSSISSGGSLNSYDDSMSVQTNSVALPIIKTPVRK